MTTKSNRRQLTTGISAVAVAVALGFASPAHAQQEFATLQGHVDGAKAGTEVVAVDAHTGQRSVGRTDASGNYSILGLRPSEYTVSVAGKPAQTATLLVGQTVEVDFAEVRAGQIVVTGRRTAQPVQAQTVATNITTAQIENLPQNTRNFLSFAALAPGVQLTSPSGAQQLQAGALSPSAVNVLLDGMSFKNPINHGGMFGQNFGIGNPFPQIAIQEYQLETQNFGAEVGQSASAVLTAITKTGGNRFHGSAFIDFQPRSFIEQPYFDKKNHVPKPDYKRYQFGGDLGGPIIPDKLTFYVAGEGTIEDLPTTTGNVQGVPSSLASQINISHTKQFKQGLYFGKLTWFATPDDTVNLEAFIRRENNLSDIDANATSSHARTILTHQDRFQVQWRHTAGDFLNFLNVAYDKATQSTPSVGTGPEFNLSRPFSSQASCIANTPDPIVQAANCGSTVSTSGGYQNPDFSVLAETGAHFFNQGDTEKSWILKDDATIRHGEHTFKAGGQVTFYDLARTVNNAFNGRYYYFNPGPSGTFDPNTNVPYGAQINIQPSQTFSGKDTQIGLYVQDEWKPDIHWTVNAGLRWDYETNANNNNYVTPPDIAAALRAYPGWQARGINPEDYISNGHNRHPYWKEFQPRLGVSYDVYGDHDTTIFGGAGRYYDRPLFIEGAIESLTNSSKVVNVTFCQPFAGRPGGAPAGCVNYTPSLLDPNNLRPIAAGLSSGLGGPVWVLPNQVKMPYSDQFDIGLRKRFGPITATVTYSHVESRNLFMFVRANFFANGWYTRFPVTNSTGAIVGCTNGGDQFINDYNNPPANFPNCPAINGQLSGRTGRLDRGQNNGRASLDALYLQVEKPFTDQSVWGFTEAVTIQSARSNLTHNLFDDEAWNEPGFGTYGWANVAGVPKWQTVTSANWRAPYGLIFSGTLTLTSGPSFGHVNCDVRIPPDAGCYANLGGVFWPKQTIAYKRLDLRVAKTFKFGGTELTADFQVFNVFNWLNRNYSEWGAGGGANPPLTENSQLSNDQRQFQAGLKFSF